MVILGLTIDFLAAEVEDEVEHGNLRTIIFFWLAAIVVDMISVVVGVVGTRQFRSTPVEVTLASGNRVVVTTRRHSNTHETLVCGMF